MGWADKTICNWIGAVRFVPKLSRVDWYSWRKKMKFYFNWIISYDSQNIHLRHSSKAKRSFETFILGSQNSHSRHSSIGNQNYHSRYSSIAVKTVIPDILPWQPKDSWHSTMAVKTVIPDILSIAVKRFQTFFHTSLNSHSRHSSIAVKTVIPDILP